MKSAIESLKAKVEEIGETGESSEDADGLQDDGAGKDEDTDSGNKNSIVESDSLPEESNVGELKDTTNKGPDPAVKYNGKRKIGDYGNQSSDDKMEKRGKYYKTTEEALHEEDDSSSNPLNPQWKHYRLRNFNN